MILPTEQLKVMIETGIPFFQRMGLAVVALEPGYVKLRVPIGGNENHVGTVYAGALFTVAEVPGGALFYSLFDAETYYPILKELTIRFVKPATTDVTFEMVLEASEQQRIAAEVAAGGKADFILEGEVRDAAGQTVAISRGHYQARGLGM